MPNVSFVPFAVGDTEDRSAISRNLYGIGSDIQTRQKANENQRVINQEKIASQKRDEMLAGKLVQAAKEDKDGAATLEDLLTIPGAVKSQIVQDQQQLLQRQQFEDSEQQRFQHVQGADDVYTFNQTTGEYDPSGIGRRDTTQIVDIVGPDGNPQKVLVNKGSGKQVANLGKSR